MPFSCPTLLYIQATLLWMATALPASGYGSAGHKITGDVAAHYLKGTRAEEEVKNLLKPKETLAIVTTWPDRAKIPEKYLTNEMKDFVLHNPNHHHYHYCDIPFQESAYREDSVGAGPDDIVHLMEECIVLLQSPEDAPENPRKLTKRVAFMLLAHLVGDIHQPLHVGTSYVDREDKFVNPNTGAEGQSDAGANYFRFTKSTSLHGYWDTLAVKKARDRAEVEDFVQHLIEHHPPQDDWKAEGAPATWPRQWARDAIGISPRCFDGIVLSDRVTVPADEEKPAHDEWKVTLPEGYAEMAADIVEVGLAKAGYRLAEVLKAIWP